MSNILYLDKARASRRKLNELMWFIDCDITNVNAKKFIKTLINNTMLYYFEDDAESAVDGDDKLLFSCKQAMVLNVIRNRFKEHPYIYSQLFNEVETKLFQHAAV